MPYESVSELFTGICDAIREQENTAALIPHREIPERIRSLEPKIPSNYGLITFTAIVPAAAEILVS